VTAPPLEPAEGDGGQPVVVPLRYGLRALYILKEQPKHTCREREPEPVLPWPPEDWEPAPW
jgi:hypothetical protein